MMYEVVANKTGVCALVHTREEAREAKKTLELANNNLPPRRRPKFSIRTCMKTRGNPEYEATLKTEA